MAKLQRVKRRLLRQLVRENLELIRGGIPKRVRRRRRGALRAAGFGLLLALLPVSSYVVSVGHGVVFDPGAPTVDPSSDPVSAGSLPSVLEAAGRTFPAPQPVDRAAFPLPVRRVVLDAGHGGRNAGAVAAGGVAEKELTLDISRRLKALLEEARIQVTLTRGADVALSLEERAELANRSGGDIFISVHVNWIEDRQARGVETYYQGPTDDPRLTRLAARENQEPGYSLADLRRILEGMYADVRTQESQRLAEAIQEELFATLHHVNPALEDRGVKRAPFVVLIATEMPAILAEVSCLSNEEEARLLVRGDYRQSIAEALFHGIQAYARSLEPPLS